MPSDQWQERFTSAFRVMRVSRETGDELSQVAGILNGGEISRNQDKSTFESGSLDFVGGFDVGRDLVRVYLDATFTDGQQVSECLGTFLAQAPDTDINGSRASGSVDLYGRLVELSDDDFDHPYQIAKGSNAVQAAMRICKESGLDVVADPSDFVLASDVVFGTGGTGDDEPDDKLKAVNALLSAAGFQSAKTDPWGRVVMRRYVEPNARPIAHVFTEGKDARFLASMERSFDRSNVANVVHADYSTQGATIRGTYIDETSEYGTQSTGRRIVKRYEFQGMPEGTTQAEQQEAADAKAKSMLETERSIIDRLTFTHIYRPLSVGDAIRMDYASAGLSKRMATRTQRLSLTAGCPIKCEARSFER